MKRLGILLLTCISMAGQAPDKVRVINFDRADGEHCSVVKVEGRSLQQSVYGGTSAAVGDSVNTEDGYFRVFVSVKQVGTGKTEIKPREFFALDSDAAHTRLSFFDKAAAVTERRTQNVAEQQGVGEDEQEIPPRRFGSSGPNASVGSSKAAKLGRMRKPDPNEVDEREFGTERDPAKAGTALRPAELYLSRCTLRHQGDTAEGFVYFRKPKKSHLKIRPQDRLLEVDLLVNGVVFRFSQ